MTRSKISLLISEIRKIAEKRKTPIAANAALEMIAQILGRRSSNELVSAINENRIAINTVEPEFVIENGSQSQPGFINPQNGALEIGNQSDQQDIIRLTTGDLAILSPARNDLPVKYLVDNILHVATISHRHGENFYVATSEDDLKKKVSKYCIEYWSEEFADEEEPDASLTVDDIIAAYFNDACRETLTMDTAQLGA